MKNISFLLLLTTIFSSCINSDNQEKSMNFEMDFLDAYKLKIGKASLFENYESFINDMGLPGKVTIVKKEHAINSKADLDKIVATVNDPDITTLHYDGIDMWFGHDYGIVPLSIDFRKTDKSVAYGQTLFDKMYTVNQFKSQFPKSAKPAFTTTQSLFEITTKEKGANLEHFMLYRQSKSDPSATPMIEFTFDNDRLIFIVFANF